MAPKSTEKTQHFSNWLGELQRKNTEFPHIMINTKSFNELQSCINLNLMLNKDNYCREITI